MAKFRYYYTDPYNGCVYGTNSREKAEELATCDEFFVIDSEKGEWLTSSDTAAPVEEYKSSAMGN